MRRVIPLAAALLCAAALAAQEPAARERLTVGGSVVSESGEIVPHAVVGLTPGFPLQFAGTQGHFAFARVPPGNYRLVVRQVGYRAFDTTVTVLGSPLQLRVRLRRVTVPLPALTFAANQPCSRPGVPDRGVDPALADLFEQLRENAARAAMLDESYPHRYLVERRIHEDLQDGTRVLTDVDTLAIHSRERWRYLPGSVVERGTGRYSDARHVHLPELAVLADSVFHRYHCFTLGGVDSVDGLPLIRLDFKAVVTLRNPDIDGSAWLDRDTYQLRRLRIELTRPGRAVRDVASMSATATFHEVFPYIAVVERLLATTLWRRASSGVTGVSEQQRLVWLEFERRPGEQEP